VRHPRLHAHRLRGGLPRAPPPPDRTAKKQAARAHAKQFRKARRGERRGRGNADKPPNPGKGRK